MTHQADKVEIVAVGDELLSGRVVDTNSAYIGRVLLGRGYELVRSTHIHDAPADIGEALRSALGRSQLVIVMGGLGPTSDDVTVNAVAAALGLRVKTDPVVLRRVRAAFRRRGIETPRPAERQARVLDGARVLANPVGMAPGMLVEQAGRLVLLLPGVPSEMKAILPDALDLAGSRLASRRRYSLTVRTFGIAESAIAAALGPVLRKHPAVRPAFYPSTNGVDIVLSGTDAGAVRRCCRSVAHRLGRSVYDIGERSLAAVVGDLLKARGLRAATAESCTGGLVGAALTDVPGSSEYYSGGVVAYSNEAKIEMLGVARSTLRAHGAVSVPVAIEMAEGARTRLGVDVGIATTGIAGPGGGSRAKPVGLVCVAVAAGGVTRFERHALGGDRRAVRERSAAAALDLCRRALEELE